MSRSSVERFVDPEKFPKTKVELQRIEKRCLAIDKIIIPRLEEILGFKISIKSLKQHFTFNYEGKIHEETSKVLVRYLSEKVMIITFSDNGLEVDELIGDAPPDLLQ